MPTTLRRVLNHLPLPQGRSGDIYVRSSWHRPVPFEQWQSRVPFRPAPTLRTNYFSRRFRGAYWVRLLGWTALAGLVLWLVVESARGLALF